MASPDTRGMVSVLAAPALVCTRGGTVEALNDAAAAWLGARPEALTDRPLEELAHASRESLADVVERCLRCDHAECDGCVRPRNDASDRRAMSCHARRLVGSGRPERALLLFAAAGAGVTADEGAVVGAGADGARALDEIALGLAHEANQPLAAIAAYAHACRRWVSADSGHHPKLLPTLDKLVEQTHVTGRLVGSLEALVRGREPAPRTHDLDRLVDESLDLLALDPRAERCAIEARPASRRCRVTVDAGQIRLVLLNLLRNALEASLDVAERPARVRVSVRARRGWASATVDDSGAGVADEARERLFEPFASTRPDGMGIGLVLCRRLASAHGGHVEYRPGVPHGAAFRLSLPLAG